MNNVSKGYAEIIQRRIEVSRSERSAAKAKIEAHRSKEVEEDPERLDRWVQKMIDAPIDVARRIARGDKSALDAVPKERKTAAESVLGGTIDFVPASFLDTGVRIKRAVARIVDGNTALGTGVLIGSNLILTNQHVLHDADEAADATIELNYEMGRTGLQPVTRFRLDPDTLYLASPEDELDYALIAIGAPVDGGEGLESFGFCPLSAGTDKHARAIFVNIVQHPDGRPKELSLRENRITWRNDRVLLYEADTLPGSSGSPVFNDFWEMIALHHYGAPSDATVAAGGAAEGDRVNEGIRVSAIVGDLQVKLAKRDETDRGSRMLAKALSLEGAPIVPDPEEVTDPEAGPEPASDPAPRRPRRDPGPALVDRARKDVPAGAVLVGSVPVEIFVRVGDGALAQVAAFAPAQPPPRRSPVREAIEIDPNYKNRRGYSRTFLPGFDLPLPKLKADRPVAPLLTPVGDNKHILNYQHFSVVVNPDRRMAWFTACNINGESWVNIDRDTGEPAESAEGKETWFLDPRIAAEHQLFQGYFDKTSVYFDRGHLVRRQDPTWGSDAKAVRANADTYHFTNCSPQNWTFNQKTKYWQGVEIHLLEHGAVLDVDRLTVFTGPVFTDNDPTVTQHKGIKVPLRYWKVAARVQDGKLRTSGFLVDQSDIFKTKRETPKPATIEKLVKEWRIAIHDIEKLTGLDFGAVADKDTFVGPESAAPREIRDWSDLE